MLLELKNKLEQQIKSNKSGVVTGSVELAVADGNIRNLRVGCNVENLL